MIENQNGHTKIYPSTQHMHSKTDGVFGVEDNNDRNIHRTTANDPLLPRLWKVEKQGNGTYKFRSANTGCVWSSYVEAGIDMPIDKKQAVNILSKVYLGTLRLRVLLRTIRSSTLRLMVIQ